MKLKEIKSFFYRQVPKIRSYFTNNLMLAAFVLGNLINATLLRFMTVRNFFDIRPIIADTAVIIIFAAFSYFIKEKRRFAYFLTMSILMSFICLLNSMYYTFYMSFASVSLLATSLQVIDVGDAVVENVIEYKDFIFIWLPVFLILLNRYLKKHDYYATHRVVGKLNFLYALNTLVVGIGLGVFFILTLSALEIGRFNKVWNREYLVMKFGIYVYQGSDIVKSIQPKLISIFGYDKAIKNFRDFYDNREVNVDNNEYTNIFEGKNILVIHAESIQQFVMDASFNGLEVTPNLNRIASEGLYFSNFYSEVSVGTSSDTEFTLNTSFLPVQSGTVFVNYWDREYVSIPKLLKEKGYYSLSMHGNNGTFWNRDVMHKSLGYDKFYHSKYYEMDDVIGLGLSDKSFFSQSIPMLKEVVDAGNPFYATLIMLSNHTPFDDVDKYGEFAVDIKYKTVNEDGIEEEVSAPYMENTKLGNYFKSVHYADEAIGEFFLAAKEAGILDNTVVVIYGDHDARLPKAEYRRYYNYDYNIDSIKPKDDPTYIDVDYYKYELNRKVPFIIWSLDVNLSREVTKVMGMYDVLPTLGNMFNFSNPFALGHDIFNIDENIVVFPNGNWLTDKIYYNNQKEEYFPLVTESLPSSYITINNEYASTILEVSNQAITYDLIKKYRESKAILEGE